MWDVRARGACVGCTGQARPALGWGQWSSRSANQGAEGLLEKVLGFAPPPPGRPNQSDGGEAGRQAGAVWGRLRRRVSSVAATDSIGHMEGRGRLHHPGDSVPACLRLGAGSPP